MKKKIVYVVLLSITCFTMALSAQIDWRKVNTLQDETFLAYVEELGLKGQASLDFWKKIPLSRANRQVSARGRQNVYERAIVAENGALKGMVPVHSVFAKLLDLER